MAIRSSHPCFGGVQHFLEVDSDSCGPMRYAVFVPPGPPAPVVYCLAGLTCTEETFAIKAGAQRVAAALGLALVTTDTSPRARRVPGDDASWDFGQGAGFYLDATTRAYAGWNLETWVTDELPRRVVAQFAVDGGRAGVCGHSMGGHGALTLSLRHPGRYASVSAFAPICAPSEVPWGERAFTGYLGDDRAPWARHDTCALLAAGARFPVAPLVDQGLADTFLATQLRPERLEAACAAAGQALVLRRHAGYDHGYWFVQTFVEDHLRFHAANLRLPG
jgi:S-formylglutathione hydrolase